MNPELIPHTLVSLMALGMGLAFVSADRKSGSSRALAATMGFVGFAIFCNIILVTDVAGFRPYAGWMSIPETCAMIAMLEWLVRVRKTVPAAPGMNVEAGDRVLRLGQWVAPLYSGLSIAFPEQRADKFLGALNSPAVLLDGWFWMFAAPVLFTLLCGLLGIILLLNRNPERPETIRTVSMAISVPFFAFSFVLPLVYSALSAVVAEIILMVGATHYHVLQGQRGQFLSRFLSPQVAQLVAERGLDRAMQENYVEITVVCCDLRGFTPFAQAHPSSRVLQVLRQYYDEVGKIVADYGGTIKDFAGDGILILVGAPLPVEHHARSGMEIARRIRVACVDMVERWSTDSYRLGIGIGVATGSVTVGVIGSASRLEYTAVGSSVNLASRLCEQALHTEILVDQRTVELTGQVGLQSRKPMAIKGFAEPVPTFCLPA